MENNEYDSIEEEARLADNLNRQLSSLKHKELQRIQHQTGSIRVSVIYLTMIQEAQNVVTYTLNLMKANRKFQTDKIPTAQHTADIETTGLYTE